MLMAYTKFSPHHLPPMPYLRHWLRPVLIMVQELVATKLELAQLKEAQLVTQRQLYKAQQGVQLVTDNL